MHCWWDLSNHIIMMKMLCKYGHKLDTIILYTNLITSFDCQCANSLCILGSHWIWVKMGEIMACCLTAPSHYLAQFWVTCKIQYEFTGSQSMASCKTAVTSLLTHWSYCSLAPSNMNGCSYHLAIPYWPSALWWQVSPRSWANPGMGQNLFVYLASFYWWKWAGPHAYWYHL